MSSGASGLSRVRIFVTQKRTRRREEAARQRKSSVAHCRGSQRPQRRTCESAVMGIMQNYRRAARERHAGIPEGYRIVGFEPARGKEGGRRMSPRRTFGWDQGLARPVTASQETSSVFLGSRTTSTLTIVYVFIK